MGYIDFKQKYAKFLKSSRYMAAKRLTVKDPDNEQWQKLVNTYFKKVVAPIEEAWQQLTKQEKGHFSPSNKKIQRREYEGSGVSQNGVPF